MVTYLFSAYFILIYVSFLIVKHYGFVMGFVILAFKKQLPLLSATCTIFSFFINAFSLAWYSTLRWNAIRPCTINVTYVLYEYLELAIN